MARPAPLRREQLADLAHAGPPSRCVIGSIAESVAPDDVRPETAPGPSRGGPRRPTSSEMPPRPHQGLPPADPRPPAPRTVRLAPHLPYPFPARGTQDRAIPPGRINADDLPEHRPGARKSLRRNLPRMRSSSGCCLARRRHLNSIFVGAPHLVDRPRARKPPAVEAQRYLRPVRAPCAVGRAPSPKGIRSCSTPARTGRRNAWRQSEQIGERRPTCRSKWQIANLGKPATSRLLERITPLAKVRANHVPTWAFGQEQPSANQTKSFPKPARLGGVAGNSS